MGGTHAVGYGTDLGFLFGGRQSFGGDLDWIVGFPAN